MPSFETSDGVRLSWTDEGAGPGVVLLAGFRASATTWMFQQRDLVERGYRVLSLDRRGQGRSEAPTFGARLARHGADVAEFLDAADLPAAAMIGGSMGASAMWSYIGLFGTSRLRAVISVDQTPAMCNGPDWPFGYYGYDHDNFGTYFASGAPPTGHGTPPDRMGARRDRLAQALGVRPEQLDAPPAALPAEALQLLLDHATQDWRDVIARLDVPALFIAGRDSQLWPCEHAAASAALNPLARAVVVDDCGHAANMEQPDVVNAAVADFLLAARYPPRAVAG